MASRRTRAERCDHDGNGACDGDDIVHRAAVRGGVASALAIVLATAMVLDRLAACGRPGLSWVPYTGVGAGIAASAMLVAALAAHGADWNELWMASGALSLVGLLACAYIIREAPSASNRPPQHRDDGESRGFPALVVAYGLFGFGLRHHRDVHLANGPHDTGDRIPGASRVADGRSRGMPIGGLLGLAQSTVGTLPCPCPSPAWSRVCASAPACSRRA